MFYLRIYETISVDIKDKINLRGWACKLVVGCIPNVCVVLILMPALQKQKNHI